MSLLKKFEEMNHFPKSCGKSVVLYCIANIIETGFIGLIFKELYIFNSVPETFIKR